MRKGPVAAGPTARGQAMARGSLVPIGFSPALAPARAVLYPSGRCRRAFVRRWATRCRPRNVYELRLSPCDLVPQLT